MSSTNRSPALLSRSNSRLLIIDVQEKLIPVIPDREAVMRSIQMLQTAATELEIPTAISEQYPQGLGTTVQELRDKAAPESLFEKQSFSAAEGLMEHFNPESDDGVRQIILAGIETHICVLQTALDLKQLGWEVFVVADAVGSRNPLDHDTALQRLTGEGVQVVTAESVLFEWCQTAAAPEFKSISRLVRERFPKTD